MSFFRKKSNFTIKFGREAANHSIHGVLVADNRSENLKDIEIYFAFVGMETPPQLTPDVLTAVFNQAKDAGYVPHHVTKYGKPARFKAPTSYPETKHIPTTALVAPSIKVA